jgi:arylsulfatase A-like enzyme
VGLAKFAAPAVAVSIVVAWAVVAGAAYGLIRRLWPRVGGLAALRVLALAALIPIVAAEGWGLWCDLKPRPAKPDIYFLLMDAFRADRLAVYGASRTLAPNLDAFAREGVVFRDAFSTSSWTKPAVASIFTSTPPTTHGVNSRASSIPTEAVTLASVLRGMGYFTVGVSANPNVKRATGMGEGFDILDDAGAASVLEAAGPRTSAARLFTDTRFTPAFLAPLARPTVDGLDLNRRLEFWMGLRGGPARFFYVHYMEPHNPNFPRPEYMAELQPFMDKVEPKRVRLISVGKYYFKEVIEDPAFVPDYTNDEIALAKAVYDTEIRRMDVVIGDLLGGVVPAGGDEAAPLVVVVADHGEEFLEHGRWLHGSGAHAEVAEVPMIVRGPGFSPAVVAGPVNLADLAPTLVSLVSGVAPREWEGRDLTPYLFSGEDVPPAPLLVDAIQAFPAGEWGLYGARIELNGVVGDHLYYLKDENAGREYLYDLTLDPRHRDNLLSRPDMPSRDTVLENRRALLKEMKRRAAERAYAPAYTKITPAMEKSLRALGYVK